MRVSISREVYRIINEIAEMDITKLRASAANMNAALITTEFTKNECLAITQAMLNRVTDQGLHITINTQEEYDTLKKMSNLGLISAEEFEKQVNKKT